MKNAIVVITTIDSKEQAESLARIIVEQKAGACVQIAGPVRSVYSWNGVIESTEEWQCIIKTASSCYSALENIIMKNHPYEVPEIIALPVSNGLPAYLKWMEETLRDKN